MEAGGVPDLAARLGSAFTFVYASIGSPSTPETWWDDPPTKGQPTTDRNHAAAMVAALDAIRADQGPFWGLIGYSQGAAAVPVYLSNVPDGTFEAAAMFCGYLTTTHTGLLEKVNEEAPFGNIPALIWSSTTDVVITPAMSRELGPVFTSPVIIESDPGPGHLPPPCDDATFNTVVAWFQNTAGAVDGGASAACVPRGGGKDGSGKGGSSAAARAAGLTAAALMVSALSFTLSSLA
jgi:hypothetical protein